ncbi:hypothetical protein Hanom_Chr09g00799461 [Helianthus anomalus]
MFVKWVPSEMVQIRVRFTRFGQVADSSISSGSGSGEDQSNQVGRFGSWQNFGFGHRVNSVKPGQLSESTRLTRSTQSSGSMIRHERWQNL